MVAFNVCVCIQPLSHLIVLSALCVHFQHHLKNIFPLSSVPLFLSSSSTEEWMCWCVCKLCNFWLNIFLCFSLCCCAVFSALLRVKRKKMFYFTFFLQGGFRWKYRNNFLLMFDKRNAASLVLVKGKCFAMKNGKYDQYFVDINLTLVLRDISSRKKDKKIFFFVVVS